MFSPTKNRPLVVTVTNPFESRITINSITTTATNATASCSQDNVAVTKFWSLLPFRYAGPATAA